MHTAFLMVNVKYLGHTLDCTNTTQYTFKEIALLTIRIETGGRHHIRKRADMIPPDIIIVIYN